MTTGPFSSPDGYPDDELLCVEPDIPELATDPAMCEEIQGMFDDSFEQAESFGSWSELFPFLPSTGEIVTFLLVAGAVLFIGFVLWLAVFIHAARIPTSDWDAAGHNKIAWLAAQVILGPLGSLLYLFWPRPAIKAARASTGPAEVTPAT